VALQVRSVIPAGTEVMSVGAGGPGGLGPRAWSN